MFVIVVHTTAGVGESRAFGPFTSAEQAVAAVPLAMAQVDGWMAAEVVEVQPLMRGEAGGPIS